MISKDNNLGKMIERGYAIIGAIYHSELVSGFISMATNAAPTIPCNDIYGIPLRIHLKSNLGNYNKRLINQYRPESKKQKIARIANDKMLESFSHNNPKSIVILKNFRTRKKVYGNNSLQYLFNQ